MRILMTGASGFVGSRFISQQAANHDITCLGRTNPGQAKVRFIETDISDPAAIKRAAVSMDGEIFDALLHLAAYVPRTAEEDRLTDATHVNVHGTVNLLEEFKGSFNKLVIGSTAEVYDQRTLAGDKLTEKSQVGASSYYGATKLASEFIAQTFARKTSTPVFVMRFSVMYGPDDPIVRALPNFIRKALAGEDLEVRSPGTLRDYIHIDDVVRSITLAIESNSQGGVLNIGSGFGVTIIDAARSVVEAVGSTSQISTVEGDGTDIVIDTTAAEEQIGFKAQILFPERLGDMIESFQDA